MAVIFCLLRMSTFLNTKDENEPTFIFKFSSYSLHCIHFHKAHFSLVGKYYGVQYKRGTRRVLKGGIPIPISQPKF